MWVSPYLTTVIDQKRDEDYDNGEWVGGEADESASGLTVEKSSSYLNWFLSYRVDLTRAGGSCVYSVIPTRQSSIEDACCGHACQCEGLDAPHQLCVYRCA